MVRESTSRTFSLDRFRLPCPGVGAGRDAPCRPGSAPAARWPPVPPGRNTCAPQPGQHAHLRARLDLEHADGVGVADHVVGRIVAWWDVLQPQRRAATLAGQLQRAAQRRQHAQRQHVDLQQLERVQVVLVPLHHAAVGHGGVLDRHQARELAARDHEAARCCDRWRGKPISVCASQAIAAPRASPGPARRRPACAAFPSCRPTTGARAPPRRSRRCPRQARGRCRAARCAVDKR